MTSSTTPVLGFIGLGNIGSPMARNVALKHPAPVRLFDANPAALAAFADTPARSAGTLVELAAQAGTSAAFTGLARRYYASAAEHGLGGRYFPTVIELIDRNLGVAAQPGRGAAS